MVGNVVGKRVEWVSSWVILIFSLSIKKCLDFYFHILPKIKRPNNIIYIILSMFIWYLDN